MSAAVSGVYDVSPHYKREYNGKDANIAAEICTQEDPGTITDLDLFESSLALKSPIELAHSKAMCVPIQYA